MELAKNAISLCLNPQIPVVSVIAIIVVNSCTALIAIFLLPFSSLVFLRKLLMMVLEIK
jgi:hypothetical protein